MPDTSTQPDLQAKGTGTWGSRLLQILSPAAFVAAPFVCAGRLDWVRGWIAVALFSAGMASLGLIVRHYNRPLLEARAKWRRKDTKPFDKIFIRILIPLAFLQPAVAGLDVVRFRWSSMPFAMVYAGAGLLALAIALIAWTMSVNPYAETTVRIQTDRGHTVVASGPYRIVRHPMYVGAILMYVATSLIFGSVGALALSGGIGVLFIWRTVLEDHMLQRELPGYAAYALHTRYRLLPGIW
jgi:protein-S-isoprenylcysteine O-methyltransferase Ste14